MSSQLTKKAMELRSGYLEKNANVFTGLGQGLRTMGRGAQNVFQSFKHPHLRNIGMAEMGQGARTMGSTLSKSPLGDAVRSFKTPIQSTQRGFNTARGGMGQMMNRNYREGFNTMGSSLPDLAPALTALGLTGYGTKKLFD